MWHRDRSLKIRAVPGDLWPIVRSTYTGIIPLVLCPPKSSQQEERGIRDERDRRNHALHGPGVDVGGFCPPRLHSLWETSPQFSGLGVGRLVLWSSPPLPPQTQSWAETQPGPGVHSIHLLQCLLRQTRQTWDIWWIHQESEALIQWASLAMRITSEGPEANRRPSLPRGADWEMETKREDVLSLKTKREDEVLWVPSWIFWLLKPTKCFFKKNNKKTTF